MIQMHLLNDIPMTPQNMPISYFNCLTRILRYIVWTQTRITIDVLVVRYRSDSFSESSMPIPRNENTATLHVSNQVLHLTLNCPLCLIFTFFILNVDNFLKRSRLVPIFLHFHLSHSFHAPFHRVPHLLHSDSMLSLYHIFDRKTFLVCECNSRNEEKKHKQHHF